MAKNRIPLSYEILCGFSEHQVELNVSSFFGYVARGLGLPQRQIKLNDVDEQMTGADGSLNWMGRAYFFQFKIPTGLKELTQVSRQAKQRANESKKQEVRRFRFDNGLTQSPHSLCFQLRRKAEGATDFQHNVLYSYNNPRGASAIYVCPLELTVSGYEREMDGGGIEDVFYRWRVQDVRCLDVVVRALEAVPFLRAHASISPHVRVDTSDHYYSFSRQATGIAFHSPEILADGPSRLSDFVAAEVKSFFQTDSERYSIKDIAKQLADVARTWAGDTLGEPTDPVDWLYRHGQLLRKHYGIRQMILLLNRS